MSKAETAKICSLFDQQLAEGSSWVQKAAAVQSGREFMALIHRAIGLMRYSESNTIEDETYRYVGHFAYLGYLAAIESVSRFFDEMDEAEGVDDNAEADSAEAEDTAEDDTDDDAGGGYIGWGAKNA